MLTKEGIYYISVVNGIITVSDADISEKVKKACVNIALNEHKDLKKIELHDNCQFVDIRMEW